MGISTNAQMDDIEWAEVLRHLEDLDMRVLSLSSPSDTSQAWALDFGQNTDGGDGSGTINNINNLDINNNTTTQNLIVNNNTTMRRINITNIFEYGGEEYAPLELTVCDDSTGATSTITVLAKV